MRRVIAYIALSCILMSCTGCFDGAVIPLANGIRMYNRYKLGFFQQAIPIAGAYDNAAAEGMGPVAGLTTLSGYSDESGIVDSPGVTLGIAWDFYWNYSTVMPECGVEHTVAGVPEAGFAINGVCDLY